jgi:hypothetical protein
MTGRTAEEMTCEMFHNHAGSRFNSYSVDLLLPLTTVTRGSKRPASTMHDTATRLTLLYLRKTTDQACMATT